MDFSRGLVGEFFRAGLSASKKEEAALL